MSNVSSLNNTVMILGGDGYLGWTLALALAKRTDDLVVLVDNLSKRKWEARVNVKSLFELKLPEERIAEYTRLYGRNNLKFENIDLTIYEGVEAVVQKYRPKTIINAAQQPSAPFSMTSPENAKITFDNNSSTNLNAVWAIGRTSNEIRYISLGSAGSYLSIDSDFIPKGKVDIEFSYKSEPHKILNSWIPMQASDIYHQSKVNSFLLNDLCTTLWGLKTITVQQSTIFGHSIPENHSEKYHALSTRFNYDHIFGTVLNRFVCQAVIGHPITVYGEGTQKTGLIALTDAIDNFMNICNMSMDNGKHIIEHNYTDTLSINDMAQAVALVAKVDIQHLTNPRLEKNGALPKVFEVPTGFESRMNNNENFVAHIKELFDFTSIYKNNIDRDFIMPSVNWSAKK